VAPKTYPVGQGFPILHPGMTLVPEPHGVGQLRPKSALAYRN